MPITTLDPITGLLVVDLQKGIVGLPVAHSAQDIVGRTAQLARAFRARRLPVALINVTALPPGRTDVGRPVVSLPPNWAEVVPELDAHADDHLVTKQCWGAFEGTTLDTYLRKCGVTQVVVTGIATSAGVESTARSAYDLGYHVTLVIDAMTDRDADAHRHSVTKIFPPLGGNRDHRRCLAVVSRNARARFFPSAIAIRCYSGSPLTCTTASACSC